MSGSSSTIRIPEHASPLSLLIRRRRSFGTTFGLSNGGARKMRDKRAAGGIRSARVKLAAAAVVVAMVASLCLPRAARAAEAPDALEASTLLGFRYRVEPN